MNYDIARSGLQLDLPVLDQRAQQHFARPVLREERRYNVPVHCLHLADTEAFVLNAAAGLDGWFAAAALLFC